MKKITEDFLKNKKFKKNKDGEYALEIIIPDRSYSQGQLMIQVSYTPDGYVAFYQVDKIIASNEMKTIEQLEGLLLSFETVELREEASK